MSTGASQPLRPWWHVQRSDDAVVATAIHDGHDLRPAIAARFALPEDQRLREEDPFTGHAISRIPTHVIPHRSRFEIDLNREIDQAIYLTPEQCWDLQPWTTAPDKVLIEDSHRYHRAFYAMLAQILDEVAGTHPCFVVLDVHSYNHRRDGPSAAPMPRELAPDINIGTSSMPREQWAWLLDPLIQAMRDFEFSGRQLDVRENVAFQGRGELTRFVHARYPGTGCAIALEFKKFFMDEWSGRPDPAELSALQAFMCHVADTARSLIEDAGPGRSPAARSPAARPAAA